MPSELLQRKAITVILLPEMQMLPGKAVKIMKLQNQMKLQPSQIPKMITVRKSSETKALIKKDIHLNIQNKSLIIRMLFTEEILMTIL